MLYYLLGDGSDSAVKKRGVKKLRYSCYCRGVKVIEIKRKFIYDDGS